MDITSIAASVGSGILGIGVIGTFVSKYAAKAKKYGAIARNAVDTLDDLIGTLEDGKLDPEEIAKLERDVALFKESLK